MRIQKTRYLCLLFAMLVSPLSVGAEPATLFIARHPFLTVAKPHDGSAAGGSLFMGRQENSLFAPLPPRRDHDATGALSPKAQHVAMDIRNLIATAEAGSDGYDAVHWNAKRKPAKKPTNMTLSQIDLWIQDTPGQPHAIGRYQFIPKTLRWLVARLDLSPDTKFTPAIQDRLANLLLADAGIELVLSGNISRATFKDNLARIWAGFPLPNGMSRYQGIAGNKATISWDSFAAEIDRILS